MSEDVGGPRWRVPLADVRLPAEALEAVRRVLEGGWLSSGPRVQEFEAAMAAYVGVEHAVACASGTAALELAYAGAGVGPEDEVVMPSLSFVAGANAAVHRGAEPVFCDVVGEDDLTLDPDSVERCLTPRTRAVVAMHYGGHPSRPEVVEVARVRGVALIEDAAHALGAEGSPGRCGAWGAAGCFSFFANKNLPLGEGGMLVTADGDLADRTRSLRSHGMTSATWDRHTGHASTYDVTAPGSNMRLDEPRAAMGTVLLGGLDAANERRGALVRRYRDLLGGIGGVTMPFAGRPEAERSAHHLAVALLPAGADRDGVMAAMRGRGIQTSVHYPPTHSFSAYRGARADVAATDAIAPRLLTLPLYPHMDERQVEEVAAALAEALG